MPNLLPDPKGHVKEVVPHPMEADAFRSMREECARLSVWWQRLGKSDHNHPRSPEGRSRLLGAGEAPRQVWAPQPGWGWERCGETPWGQLYSLRHPPLPAALGVSISEVALGKPTDT